MRRIFLLCVALVVSVETRIAAGYEPETHREIAIQAAQPDGLTDHVLKDELGIKGGVKEVLPGQRQTLQELVGEGAFWEDAPLVRRLNHFHNPLLSWDVAGLRFLGLRYQSSVVWQQNRDQDSFVFGGSNWSWQDARQRYFAALTGLGLPQNTKEQRDLLLADTFRTVGHLTHLIQDASVPGHSRNDQHLVFEGYESWAERARRDLPRGERALFLQYLALPIKPPSTIFTPGRQEAPIPIARLIDRDLFEAPGDFGPLLDPALGIAEYSNGNFLSDDTIFQDFLLPRRESLDLNSPFLEPDDQDPSRYRRYFPKVAEGQRVTHFVAESTLYKDATESAGQPISDALGLTRPVYRDYAAELLPRAVGYSAALLDYFFRGRLEATIEGDPADPRGLLLTAKNATPAESLERGTLTIYADYPEAEGTGGRTPLATWGVPGPVSPGADLFGNAMGFSPPSGKPVPARYMVVYQGDLGEEKKDSPPGFGGAVIGKAAKYGGVLEELILFRTTNNTYDVYFRNQFQITLLNLSERLPVVSRSSPPYVGPAEVHWGVDTNHFFVKTYEIQTVANTQIGVPVYHIYRINRPANSVSGDEPVQAALLKTIKPREARLPPPYGYREIYINAPELNRTGEEVYPYGTVFTAPYFNAPNGEVYVTGSTQEVLSEDLGDGRGLEIYALFRARVWDEIYYVEQRGGSGQSYLGVHLIIQASTGAIVYADPVSGAYTAQAAAEVSRGHHAAAWFYAWPRTWLVSWSDRDVTKRRWVTQLQVDDVYTTYDVTPENRITNEVDHFVENSVQTVLVEQGQPKFSITPKQTYVAYSPYQGEDPVEVFYPAALVPTMSSEQWLWVDEPDMFTPPEDGADILRRTQYLMSTETGQKQRVGEWTPADSANYAIAPKIREMVMLQPGYLYAHGDPVYAIPQLFGYEGSASPLDQDLTSAAEKQKFVRFLAPDGRVDPAFTTAAPLVEDPDLRGKGRVSADSYPPGFQAVLDTLLNPYPDTKVSWHVVPDADLVPARRR